MPRRAITPEFYARLVEAFRKYPAQWSVAAKEAGCDRGTAKRGWINGWQYPWAKPISEVVGDPQIAVRAKAAEIAAEKAAQTAMGGAAQEIDTRRAAFEAEMLALRSEAEKVAEAARAKLEASEAANRAAQEALSLAQGRANTAEDEGRRVGLAKAAQEAAEALAKARQDAADTLLNAQRQAQERIAEAERAALQRKADLLRDAQVDALETLAQEAGMVKLGRRAALGAVGAAAIVFGDSQTIGKMLHDALVKGSLTPVQLVKATALLTRMVESAERAVQIVFQAERLRVGEPTEILGLRAEKVPVVEVETKLDAIQRAIARAKAKAAPPPAPDPGPLPPNVVPIGGGGNVH